MPRPKKERITKRKDKRFLARYHGKCFYSRISSEDAIAKRNAYKKAVEAGFLPMQTVAEYSLPWIERSFPNVARSTYAGLAVHLQHLINEIGNRQIASIVPSDIKQVYTNQYRDCSASYLKSARQLFCSLFDSAVADGLCRSNPARDKTAKPHAGKRPKTRPITSQEREWINTLCTNHRAFPAVMTMLYAGIRPQEMKAFKIDRDVDFQNNIITLHEFAHNADNMQSYDFTTKGKTDNAIRKIPLFQPLKNVLQGRTGYLITSAHGEKVNHTTWRVAWRSYVNCMETAINGMPKRWYGKTRDHKRMIEAGEPLPEWIPFDIVPYDLRHSYCVWIRDAGIEMNTARIWMGHSDAKMILKVYDAVSTDRSDSERKKLETGANGSQSWSHDKKPDAQNG